LGGCRVASHFTGEKRPISAFHSTPQQLQPQKIHLDPRIG